MHTFIITDFKWQSLQNMYDCLNESGKTFKNLNRRKKKIYIQAWKGLIFFPAKSAVKTDLYGTLILGKI